MMKKLLKNFTCIVALGVASLSFGQINIAFDNSLTTIGEDGSLPSPVVVTLTNIPYDSGVTANSRVYATGTAISGGNHIGQGGATFSLDQLEADVDNANMKTETTLATPDATHFTRVYTLKKYGALSSTANNVDLSIRFVGAFSASPALTFVQTPESGGNVNNATFRLNTNLSISTLGVNNVNSVAQNIYPNPVSSVLNISSSVKTQTYKIIDLQGKTVKDVEATGSVDVSGLSSGVYVLKTDVGSTKFVKK